LATSTAPSIRFGEFELDVRAAELRKGDLRIRLQEQSFQILLMLLEHPGEVVTREEVRKRLWPNDTIVEFDHSIGTAIKKVRQALGDEADSPRYVETLPKRGFRFIFPVGGTGVPPVEPHGQDGHATPGDFTHSDLIGRTLSHYRILKRLAGGGMGVVYKAEDTRLGRKVALKFLPTDLAGHPVALARFDREARAASALNHPHICTIYEIEEVDAQPFLAMELLEGQTLKELIGRGALRAPEGGQSPPLPVDTLVDLAIQIADALETAHAAGIIHRDIKPANIFVTKRGDAKILDFGLAKFQESGFGGQGSGNNQSAEQSLRPLGGEGAERSEAGAGVSPHDTPTVTIDHEHLTIAGATMGTAAYMSPEQARGEDVDARTDLFSFGAVLYEMATGQQAFTGTTSEEIRETIMKREATPAQRLNPVLSPRLQAIVEKALEKDRDVRYQHAADILADLKRLKRDTSAGRSQAATHEPRQRLASDSVVSLIRRHRSATIVAVALVAALAGIAWLVLRGPPQPSAELTQKRLTFNSSENPVGSSAISPDGKYLAYSDPAGIHVKLISTGEERLIPRPTGVPTGSAWRVASWFPDGTQLLADTSEPGGRQNMWTVSVLGQSTRELREGASGVEVSPDGTHIAFVPLAGAWEYPHEIWVMGSRGDSPHQVLALGDNDSLNNVHWSPDGQRLAYMRFRLTAWSLYEGGWPPQGVAIETSDLHGANRTVVVSSADMLLQDYCWLREGRIVYARQESPGSSDANLWQISVDGHFGTSTGKPKRIT